MDVVLSISKQLPFVDRIPMGILKDWLLKSNKI